MLPPKQAALILRVHVSSLRRWESEGKLKAIRTPGGQRRYDFEEVEKTAMTIVTSQEIAQFRSQLSNNPQAMTALDAIEDCEGDLEDAAISLAIRAGQQPQRDNSEWLDALARKCRAAICQEEFRQDLINGSYGTLVRYLEETRLIPSILATPVVMYAIAKGIIRFCEPLDSQYQTRG